MRNWLFALLGLVGCLIGTLVLLGSANQLRTFRVPTGSMRPTLLPGDNFFMEKVTYHFHGPRRGDIVVFRTEGISGIPQPDVQGSLILYVQRVVGLPGDKLELRHRQLFVNGKEAGATRFLRPESRSKPPDLTDDKEELLVPANCYFVIGDNRENSYDSRYWGFLPAKNVEGRGWLRSWPISRAGFL
jgi:signal peptidase I